MVWISEGIAGILLLWLSICDLKSSKIPMWGLMSFCTCGVVRLLLLERSMVLTQGLLCLWIWLSLWLAAKASGHGIGGGDVWLLTSMPFWRTGGSLIWTLLVAFLSAAVYGFLRFGVQGRKTRFPFVPWITVGFVSVGIAMTRKGLTGI